MKAISKQWIIFIIYLVCALILILYALVNVGYPIGIISISAISIACMFAITKISEKEHQRELENIFKVLDDFENNTINNNVNIYEETLISKYYYNIFNLITLLKTQAEKNKSEKDEIQKIVATISHQAKNSLTIVNNYYELKSLDDLDENDLVIKTEIDKMNFLFNNLIKIARVEISDIVLKEELVDINYLCLKLIKDCYRLARDKNINIEFNNQEKYMVLADVNWTMEALYNLIHNAIKYSDYNSTIEISVIKYYSFVSIKIKDYGMGIDDGDKKNIFKKFYRGKNSYELEGLGVGLFLTQEIINRQGGFIKVDSSLGEFTIFEVFLKVESI